MIHRIKQFGARRVTATLVGRCIWPWLAALLLVIGHMPSRLAAQVRTPQQTRLPAQQFPHAKHEQLFPQCAGCHAGITTGTAATSFPDTTLCGECHNNRDSKKVRWTAPVRTVTNLSFSHPKHRALTEPTGSTCTSCHATPGAKWMHVERASPAQCLTCHTHKATAHLAADNRCATCHVPLTKAPGLTAARIEKFPRPASHDARDFAARHDVTGDAAQAQCATCHARESCARCHVNATTITNRFQLAPDARVASLVANKPAVYTTPTTHSTSTFLQTHGPQALASGASCANCHARASCQSCHTGTGAADAIARLPIAESGAAAGVQLTTKTLPWKLTANENVPVGRVALGPALVLASNTTQPPRATTQPRRAAVHPAGFARTHGVQAATSRPTCEGCHARSYCADCHAGESSRKFHVANFVARHAPEAFGRETDCQQCHSREVFCRSCHLQVGLSSKGRSNVGYHSAVPLWALQHGQAARQGLQSCTSCHTQKDCMQCHAQGGRGINPHGPGFDAQRMWRANRLTCLRCHLKDPLTGR